MTMNEMLEDLLVLLGVGIIFLILVSPVIAGILWWESYSCGKKFVGVNTEWSIAAGCQVEAKPGIWIPAENYRQF